MHLAVDAVGIKHSGGATVLSDFLAAAVEDDRVARLTVFCSPPEARSFAFPGSEKLVERPQAAAERNRAYRFWWFERRLEEEVRRARADALLCMSWGGVASRAAPQVTFVQQSLLFCGEASRTFGVVGRASIGLVRLETRRACRASRSVIVQTPTMREWVSRDFGVPEERVTAVIPSVALPPRGASPSPALASMRATAPDRRLLYVGNDMPYKNLERVARAMRRVRAAAPGATLFVTFPGEHEIAQLEGVVGLGYLKGSELREAYEAATLLVMPSLVETIGLPMLEAMSVGTPVLAADRPYARDVCGDAAEYFDPLDAAAFASAAAGLLDDPDRRDRMRSRGTALAEALASSRPYARMVDEVLRVAGS